MMILEELKYVNINNNINTTFRRITTYRPQVQKFQATTMSLLKKYHSIQIMFLLQLFMGLQVASSLANNIFIGKYLYKYLFTESAKYFHIYYHI